MTKIFLASASPRRRDLLKYHFDLKICPAAIDESLLRSEKARAYVLRVAKEKWIAASKKIQGSEILVSADTTVVVGNKILGKPESKKDCARMIGLLSGKSHFVYSAVCVGWSNRRPKIFVVRSEIKFRRISASELSNYIQFGDWHDKAGAYAIQGMGLDFVEYYRGSFTNIVGLPIIETLRELNRLAAQ